MSRQDSWSCLLVQQFFSLCNWQGQRQRGGAGEQGSRGENDANFPPSPPFPLTPSPPLLCLSVQKFFSLCNWQAQPLENRNWHHVGPSSRLTMQVREFFQFIPWEGNPEIGSLPKVSSIPDPTLRAPLETTLTDLSELF